MKGEKGKRKVLSIRLKEQSVPEIRSQRLSISIRFHEVEWRYERFLTNSYWEEKGLVTT